MRKHSGEMPFSCSHCPKRFRSMRNLENHSRIHTGEKPFKCRTCGRRFTTSSGLCQHFKKSSGCRRNLEDTTGSYTANLEENSDTQIRTCIILVSAGEIILNIWIWGGGAKLKIVKCTGCAQDEYPRIFNVSYFFNVKFVETTFL